MIIDYGFKVISKPLISWTVSRRSLYPVANLFYRLEYHIGVIALRQGLDYRRIYWVSQQHSQRVWAKEFSFKIGSDSGSLDTRLIRSKPSAFYARLCLLIPNHVSNMISQSRNHAWIGGKLSDTKIWAVKADVRDFPRSVLTNVDCRPTGKRQP